MIASEPRHVWRRPRASATLVIRSAIFSVYSYGLLAGLAVVGSPSLLGSRRNAMPLIRAWVRATIWGLRVICGVEVELRGREHLRPGAALIAAKHLSMLDTIAPLLWLDDPVFVIKRELMRLPFFGWYAKKLDMLPIDRAGGAKTLRALVQGARARLGQGRQILIYPEGTRQLPGAPLAYKPGVAALYRDLGAPCTPLATNAGLHWPAHGFLRFPGRVVFEFLPTIPTGLSRAAFMARLTEAIETASDRLIAQSEAESASEASTI